MNRVQNSKTDRSQTSSSQSLANPDCSKDSLSRRTFLEKSGTALAATTFATMSALPAYSAPKKIRIGVVGGGFGCSFQWHEHPDCVVQAVSDLRADRRERLVKTYGCEKVYNSLAELVKDKDIDAVAIFTDGPLHVEHVVEAMKNGKHTISAVPACWGTIEQADLLYDTVKKYGLTYMMAETSYYQQKTISARKFHQEGKFGDIFYCESEYQHPGLDVLYWDEKKNRTWRYGIAPMHYPTHCTAHLVSVTGERLKKVVCTGWGDDSPVLKDNPYNNPFWNGCAMFTTNRENSFRVNVWWKGAFRGCERAQWIGSKMSYYSDHPNGLGSILIRTGGQTEKDDAGFERALPDFEPFEVPAWYMTDLLPEPLRHDSGHEGSHTFLTHEFVTALVEGRSPTVNVHEALAYTVPGIVAHQSALQGGAELQVPQYD